MVRFLPHVFFFASLLIPFSAQSEEPTSNAPSEAEPKPEGKGAGAEAQTSNPGQAANDLDARRRQALTDYGVGHIDAAYTELEVLIKKCDEEGEAICPDQLRAKLYVALAIVLAGGKGDEKGGARLFHAALTRDPNVTVPREFATRPVQAAMREANESTTYEELTKPSAQTPAPDPKEKEEPQTSVEPESEKNAEATPESRADNKTGILLLHAIAGAGGDDYEDGAAFGAAAVLGARFVDSSAWTTAIRGRAVVLGQSEESLAGVSLLMGGSWFNPKNRRMGYFLGGLGLDSYAGEGGFSLNGMGGVSLGGFLIGGGVDFGASGYGSFGMMTLHLGWGGRL